MNMVEPPACQAATLTGTIWSGFKAPWCSAWKVRCAVISLVRLAGGTGRLGAASARMAPEEPSIRT